MSVLIVIDLIVIERCLMFGWL